MTGFGRANPFPFTFGGGDSAIETVHQALLEKYAPAWDVSDEKEMSAVAYAEAICVGLVWACNKRLANQLVPSRMLEALTDFEEATRLRPAATERDNDRRSALAAKLRGLSGNTLSDIEAACQALLGNNFDELVQTPEANAVTFWPGVNPGPPGLEWSSTRARLTVVMTKDGLTDSEFLALKAKLSLLLGDLLPCWMTYEIGVGSGFLTDEGLLDETLL